MRPPFLERMNRIAQVVTDGERGAVIILKCASRSMISSGHKIVMAKNADQLPPVIDVFVRDPIERLRSAFQFFRGHPPFRVRHQWKAKSMASWENFVDAILEGVPNPHWRPVADTLDLFPESANFNIVAFEEINEKWGLRKKLEKKNKSIKMDNIDLNYRRDELREFYARDYALRRQAGRD